MSESNTTFFNLPIVPAVVRPALEAKAKELGLVINPYMEYKIEWSEEHDGRCMCDWNNRKCPCDNILKDLSDFNGQCLCKVLVTKEKMEKIEKDKSKKTIKKVKKVKTEEQIEKDKAKLEEAKELAKKLGCKGC